MAERTITAKIIIEGKETLDECVEQANQLVELLEKAQQIVNSLSKNLET